MATWKMNVRWFVAPASKLSERPEDQCPICGSAYLNNNPCMFRQDDVHHVRYAFLCDHAPDGTRVSVAQRFEDKGWLLEGRPWQYVPARPGTEARMRVVESDGHTPAVDGTGHPTGLTTFQDDAIQLDWGRHVRLRVPVPAGVPLPAFQVTPEDMGTCCVVDENGVKRLLVQVRLNPGSILDLKGRLFLGDEDKGGPTEVILADPKRLEGLRAVLGDRVPDTPAAGRIPPLSLATVLWLEWTPDDRHGWRWRVRPARMSPWAIALEPEHDTILTAALADLDPRAWFEIVLGQAWGDQWKLVGGPWDYQKPDHSNGEETLGPVEFDHGNFFNRRIHLLFRGRSRRQDILPPVRLLSRDGGREEEAGVLAEPLESADFFVQDQVRYWFDSAARDGARVAGLFLGRGHDGHPFNLWIQTGEASFQAFLLKPQACEAAPLQGRGPSPRNPVAIDLGTAGFSYGFWDPHQRRFDIQSHDLHVLSTEHAGRKLPASRWTFWTRVDPTRQFPNVFSLKSRAAQGPDVLATRKALKEAVFWILRLIERESRVTLGVLLLSYPPVYRARYLHRRRRDETGQMVRDANSYWDGQVEDIATRCGLRYVPARPGYHVAFKDTDHCHADPTMIVTESPHEHHWLDLFRDQCVLTGGTWPRDFWRNTVLAVFEVSEPVAALHGEAPGGGLPDPEGDRQNSASAVVDLGAGTSDIAIDRWASTAQAPAPVVDMDETVEANGSAALGGDDFDVLVALWLWKRLRAEGHDLGAFETCSVSSELGRIRIAQDRAEVESLLAQRLDIERLPGLRWLARRVKETVFPREGQAHAVRLQVEFGTIARTIEVTPEELEPLILPLFVPIAARLAGMIEAWQEATRTPFVLWPQHVFYSGRCYFRSLHVLLSHVARDPAGDLFRELARVHQYDLPDLKVTVLGEEVLAGLEGLAKQYDRLFLLMRSAIAANPPSPERDEVLARTRLGRDCLAAGLIRHCADVVGPAPSGHPRTFVRFALKSGGLQGWPRDGLLPVWGAAEARPVTVSVARTAFDLGNGDVWAQLQRDGTLSSEIRLPDWHAGQTLEFEFCQEHQNPNCWKLKVTGRPQGDQRRPDDPAVADGLLLFGGVE